MQIIIAIIIFEYIYDNIQNKMDIRIAIFVSFFQFILETRFQFYKIFVEIFLKY